MFLENHKSPYIFGHRGYSEIYPENTLLAFQKCIENSVNGVELDVQVCKTGEVIINHDFDFKRVGNVSKEISELTLDEIKEIDVGYSKSKEFKGTKVATLEELFKVCNNKLYYDIELKEKNFKDTGLAKKVLDLIRKYNLENNCIISSFNPFSVRRFNKISNFSFDTAIIFGEGDGPRLLWHGFGRHIAKCNILKPDYNLIDEKFMKKFSKKYRIMTWTVNSEKDAKKLLNLKVDGLCGNDPVKLKKLF